MLIPRRIPSSRVLQEEEEVRAVETGDQNAKDDGDDLDVNQVVLVEVGTGIGEFNVVLQVLVLGEGVGRGALGGEADQHGKLIPDFSSFVSSHLASL